MNYILIFFIIVFIIIFIAWIYYINWRSSIIGNLKNKVFYKRKKIRKRTISNKEIKENFKYLQNELNFRFIKIPKRKLFIEESLQKRLKYSDFRLKEVNEIATKVFEYMNIQEVPAVEVNYYSSRKKPPYAGIYNEEKKKISLYINLRDDTYESVLSCLIHETTHHFLISNGIRRENTRKNEILTDLCTVYMGLGKEMYEGYKLRNKILFINDKYKYQNWNKVGYINPGDIKYAMKIRKKYLTKQ